MKCPYCYGTGKSNVRTCRLCGKKYADWGARICQQCYEVQDAIMKAPIAVVKKLVSELLEKN